MNAVAGDRIGEFAGSAAPAAGCAHCGSRLAEGSRGQYCCAGCAAASRIITGLGFDEFYRRRVLVAAARPLRPEEAPEADYTPFVVPDGKGGASLHLMVDGLTCAACVWLIEAVLARQPEVTDGRVNMSTRRLTLRWHGAPELGARFVGLIAALGFRVVPFDPTRLRGDTEAAERQLLRAMAVAGFAAGNVMLLSVAVWAGHAEGMGQATRDLMHWISALIALPALAYAGLPFFRPALAALKAGRTNMDVPISVGVVLASAASLFATIESGPHAYFDSAITLLFFLLIGRYLDTRARGRARSAVERMLALTASAVTLVRADGSAVLKPVSAVKPGDVILVAAGERVPVDGRIVLGRSDLDTSLITGESVPVTAAPGGDVFAGALNLTSPLRVEARAVGEGTLLSEIVRLMEAAEQGRTRFVALADRVARLYAPVVHVLGAATFLGWVALGAGWQFALLTAVAVLIITCPCALALAVPAAQVVASGRLMREGTLLKSPTALERLAKVDTVVFDKTGTLTLGRLELQPDAGRSEADTRLAAGMARASRHPLARALVRAMPDAPALPDVLEHPGLGLSATWSGMDVRLGNRRFCGVPDGADADSHLAELWLARPGAPPVRFSFSDSLRPDAVEAVAALRQIGVSVEVLSGDRAAVVGPVAQRLGIAQWQAACGPAEKCERLAALRRSGRNVMMVGDGLNDAPALAAASVSMSPSTAADVSQTAADIVFQGERLAPVADALAIARTSERVVRQNIAAAIIYNLGAIPLAVAGYVTPLIAAAAMSSSSVIVIVNSLRLAGWRRRTR